MSKRSTACLDPESIAKENPKVDIVLVRQAQAEMKKLGIKPATYNLKNPYVRFGYD